MTMIINIWTMDGRLHAFRQTNLHDVEVVLAHMRQPDHLFEKALIVSTSLCTSLIAGHAIARIEAVSHEIDMEKLLADHAIQLVSLDPGVESSPHSGKVGAKSVVRVDLRLLGETTFSAGYKNDMPSLARTDILQELARVFDAGWFYYKIGESGIGLVNTRAVTNIDIHADNLVLPGDAWHANDGTFE